MCSNNNNMFGNNMNSFNNPNLANGNIGLVIENGNNGSSTVLTANTTPYNNNEALNAGNFNNNSCNCNNNSCSGNDGFNNNSCNDILSVFNNNNNSCNYNNNSCGCNCNGNNSCNCNGNNSCACNCIGNNNNNNDSDNITRESLQRNLRNFIGRRVTLEFNNCGTCTKKTGVLTCVGCNFVTLRSVNNNTCMLADTAGLNFVTVHNCCS